jgi:hypothetical protein
VKPVTDAEIETRFTYHRPSGDQPQKYESIRNRCKDLAILIVEITPESREQALALTKLEEVSMWANAAIARRS